MTTHDIALAVALIMQYISLIAAFCGLIITALVFGFMGYVLQKVTERKENQQ